MHRPHPCEADIPLISLIFRENYCPKRSSRVEMRTGNRSVSEGGRPRPKSSKERRSKEMEKNLDLPWDLFHGFWGALEHERSGISLLCPHGLEDVQAVTARSRLFDRFPPIEPNYYLCEFTKLNGGNEKRLLSVLSSRGGRGPTSIGADIPTPPNQPPPDTYSQHVGD